MTGGLSIVFSRKAAAIETFFRRSNNLSKSIISTAASHFYPYSRCRDLDRRFEII